MRRTSQSATVRFETEWEPYVDAVVARHAESTGRFRRSYSAGSLLQDLSHANVVCRRAAIMLRSASKSAHFVPPKRDFASEIAVHGNSRNATSTTNSPIAPSVALSTEHDPSACMTGNRSKIPMTPEISSSSRRDSRQFASIVPETPFLSGTESPPATTSSRQRARHSSPIERGSFQQQNDEQSISHDDMDLSALLSSSPIQISNPDEAALYSGDVDLERSFMQSPYKSVGKTKQTREIPKQARPIIVQPQLDGSTQDPLDVSSSSSELGFDGYDSRSPSPVSAADDSATNSASSTTRNQNRARFSKGLQLRVIAADADGDGKSRASSRLKIKLKRHQREAVEWMLKRESQNRANRQCGTARGGILADDTGMGKTVTAIALMAKGVGACEQRAPADRWQPALHGCHPVSLVVVPLSVMPQWIREFQNKTRLAVYVHHGPKRFRSFGALQSRIHCYDVVLTTYSLLAMQECSPPQSNELFDCTCHCDESGNANRANSCWKRALPQQPSGTGMVSCLHRIRWERIVLDEAHLIVNPRTHRAAAARGIECKRGRWCLTATPVQNKGFEDIAALFRFLRVPLSEYSSSASAQPVPEKSPFMQLAVKTYMLRRLKPNSLATSSSTGRSEPNRSNPNALDDHDHDHEASEHMMKRTREAAVGGSPAEKRSANMPTPQLHRSVDPPEPLTTEISSFDQFDDSDVAVDVSLDPQDTSGLDFPVVEHVLTKLSFRSDFESEFYNTLEHCTKSNLVEVLAAQHQPAKRPSQTVSPISRAGARGGPKFPTSPSTRRGTDDQRRKLATGSLHVFDWLTKCRQFCCHPYLVFKAMSQAINKAEVAAKDADEATMAIMLASMRRKQAQKIRDKESRTIPSPKSQSRDQVDSDEDSESLLMDAATKSEAAERSRELSVKYQQCFSEEQWGLFREMCREKGAAFVSTKLSALVSDLRQHLAPAHQGNDCASCRKFVVLTSWTSYLELICTRLRREGYVVGELHGGQNIAQRRRTLDQFARNDVGSPNSMAGLVATLGTAGVGACIAYVVTRNISLL